VASSKESLDRAKEDLRIYLLQLGHSEEATTVVHQAARKAPQMATAHREPSGLPPIKQSIVSILNGKIMNAKHVYEQLVALKLMPPSNDPQSYVATVLASNASDEKGDTFQRVDRGLYTVRAVKKEGSSPQTQATG